MQTQPGAGGFAFILFPFGRLGGKERIEDGFQLIGGNTAAGIADVDVNMGAVLAGAHAQAPILALPHRIQGVVDQVLHHLSDVGIDQGKLGQALIQLQFLLSLMLKLGIGIEKIKFLLQQAIEIDRFGIGALIHAALQHQVIDDLHDLPVRLLHQRAVLGNAVQQLRYLRFRGRRKTGA